MSQFNAPTYEVERPTGRCSLTDKEFVPGEVFYATLVEMSDKEIDQLREQSKNLPDDKKPAALTLGLKRLDVCAEAWEQNNRPGNIFSHWKTTQPEPQTKRKLFVDNHVLMSLLERLEKEEDPGRLAFRYVLALILLRKKMLRYDGVQREDEKVYWQLTPKLDLSKGPMGKWNEERTMLVLDPKLDEAGIEQVTDQLGEILEGDL